MNIFQHSKNEEATIDHHFHTKEIFYASQIKKNFNPVEKASKNVFVSFSLFQDFSIYYFRVTLSHS
jgi:hypothetical protein